MADDRQQSLSREQMEDMIVVAAFLEFLKSKGSIPDGMGTGEALDLLRSLSVTAPNAKHPYWECEVGDGSGPLQGFHARGTVRFTGPSLQEALWRVKALSPEEALDIHVEIPPGTIVTVVSETRAG